VRKQPGARARAGARGVTGVGGGGAGARAEAHGAPGGAGTRQDARGRAGSTARRTIWRSVMPTHASASAAVPAMK